MTREEIQFINKHIKNTVRLFREHRRTCPECVIGDYCNTGLAFKAEIGASKRLKAGVTGYNDDVINALRTALTMLDCCDCGACESSELKLLHEVLDTSSRGRGRVT